MLYSQKHDGVLVGEGGLEVVGDLYAESLELFGDEGGGAYQGDFRAELGHGPDV